MDEHAGIFEMTSGLIVNPRSGKQRGIGIALADRLRSRGDVHVKVLEQFADLDPTLIEFAKLGVTTLFISSGDGTVQHVQTQLAEQKPFEQQPELCLLPHGTTNMTAADLGFGSKALDEQFRAITDKSFRKHHTTRKTRVSLRVVNPADGVTRHGMFLGTGAIWRSTVFCQQAIHKTGLRGDWATFATLATAVIRSLLARADSQDPDRISQPHEMAVKIDNGATITGGRLFFLATTLEKLILGSRPFWGKQHGAIRGSVFPYPPPNIPRWLWPAMYGTPDRTMPQGCESFSADFLTISISCPFVIDGEFFDPPVDEPLRIEKGADFTYVCKA